MYEITKPSPILIPDPTDPSKKVEYGLLQFAKEFLFRDMKWRDEWASEFEPALAALSAEGPTCLLTDACQDKLKTCAKTFQLPPEAQGMYFEIMRFIHSITKANFLNESKNEAKDAKKK